MKKEKSCGAVIYKYENSKLYILLLKHNQGHWSFSKGHIENEETEKETALREIKEETNLDVCIDNNFRYLTTYSPKENTIKDVVYFVATPLNDDIKIQEKEISEISWYSAIEALDKITYDNDKQVLKKTIEYLNKNS